VTEIPTKSYTTINLHHTSFYLHFLLFGHYQLTIRFNSIDAIHKFVLQFSFRRDRFSGIRKLFLCPLINSIESRCRKPKTLHDKVLYSFLLPDFFNVRFFSAISWREHFDFYSWRLSRESRRKKTDWVRQEKRRKNESREFN
jgi:hypothetical protein